MSKKDKNKASIDDLEDPLVLSSSNAINELLTPPGAPIRFLSRGLNLIYGTGGAGKTSLCLDACLNSIDKLNRILYVDTERGIDLWRVKQMMKERNIKTDIVNRNESYIIGSMKIVYEPTLEGLLNMLKRFQTWKPDLLVIDNVTSHYIVLICDGDASISSYGRPSKYMIKLTGVLLTFTYKWKMTVALTSQEVGDITRKDILELEEGVGVGAHDKRRWVGGKALEYNPKVRVRITKKGIVEREMVLEKHRSKRPGEKCMFKICDRGVCDL